MTTTSFDGEVGRRRPMRLRVAATIAGALISLCLGAAAAEDLHLPRDRERVAAQEKVLDEPPFEAQARANAIAYPYAPPPPAAAPAPAADVAMEETTDADETGADGAQRPLLMSSPENGPDDAAHSELAQPTSVSDPSGGPVDVDPR